ncbi:MAG: hypothetical protein JWO03_2018 [Bacteroidetes bacterium]|nr:hypothetical protein [Bacteroidota bacterium]
MKNIFISFLVFMAGVSIVNAQVQGFSCTAGEETQKQYDKHPELLVAKAQLDAFTKQYVAQHQGQNAQRTGNLIVIPVVFHIEHDAGVEDISDATVFTEMDHWNEYMQARNPELSTTDSAFVPLIGNPNIEFRLAQIDPHGRPTNGIERIYTQSTYYGNNNTKLNPWPREKYLNVWLTKGIDRDVTFYGTLAYSMYPSGVSTYVNNDIIDGIIAKYFVVGGTAQFSRPTLAHECGHWMNLEHVWGNTNAPEVACGDDDVADTPPTKGNQNTCIHNLCVCARPILDQQLHDSIPGVIENEQNIMNYAECHFMFTQGQVDRMMAALNSPVAGRLNIWSDSNNVACGTNLPVTYPNPNSLAVPVADFAVNNRYICSGGSVKFTDVSWNAQIDSRTWTFPADVDLGTSTVNDVSPVVIFNTPGWQEVTLQVSNANGSNSKVKTMVYVADGSAITAPYFEDFENPGLTGYNWKSLNYDDNNTSFQLYQGAGHYSNASYRMNMYNANYDGDLDELVSPIFDLTNVDPSQLTLSFDYSYATNDANHMSDSVATFTVYGSRDCGNSWNKIYFNAGGFNLYNAGTISNRSYVPGQQDEYWQNISLTLPPAYATPNVNFKWSLTSAKSANQFYIDNVNVGQAIAGINAVKANTVGTMNIIPNPTQGAAVLALNITSSSANTTAKMYDMEGREIMTIFSGQTQAGQKNVSFDTENISSGIYVIKVTDGKTAIQKRFVKM